jgi:hypothetical protein
VTGRLLFSAPPQNQSTLEAATVTPIGYPVLLKDVELVASPGFPLRESVPTLRLRNMRITLAYESLGRQLADLLATGDGPRVANWCTFASWSSRTIGATINPYEIPPGLRDTPKAMQRKLVTVAQRMTRRNHGAVFRSLAVGNRFIFLEIGTAVALFLQAFSDLPVDRPGQELAWKTYNDTLTTKLDGIRRLDPSWTPTAQADPEQLRRGLRLYFDALVAGLVEKPTSSRDRLDGLVSRQRNVRSELILAANIQIGAYEQVRADGYVAASLSLRGTRALRRLIVCGTGAEPKTRHRVFARCFARIVTRFGLAVILPNEIVKIGDRLQAPLRRDGSRSATVFGGDVGSIESPELQALMMRFDFDDFDSDQRLVMRRRVKNWLDFSERMHYIANLFRAYHEDQSLLSTRIFTYVEHELLCAGKLPDEESTS